MLQNIKYIALVGMVLFSWTAVNAQNASWNYSIRSGSLGVTYDWVDCSVGGTELDEDDITNYIRYSGYDNPQDDGRWEINWPFDFKFYDDTYTTSDVISIGTNGFIRLDGDASMDYRDAENFQLGANSTSFGQIIALGLSDDNFSGTNSFCYYKVTGTAPNRKLIIEFQNMSIYNFGSEYCDSQVEFHETSNKIVLKTGENDVSKNDADFGLHSGVNGYYFYWQDSEYGTFNSWIEFSEPTSIPAPQDSDSYVDDTGLTQPSSTNIPSSALTEANAFEVFKFAIFDRGTSDAAGTNVQKIRIKKHSSSTANWHNTVAGIVLNDGTRDLDLGMITSDVDYIDILLDKDELVIPDGGRVDISMSLYLRNTESEVGNTFRFYIDVNNHGWLADPTGSLFASNFGGSDIISNTFTISFAPTQLTFVRQPLPIAYVNETLNPAIQVAVTDAGGNIDTNDNSTVITLTNVEGIGMSNASATVSNGVATFTNLTFTETGGPFELYANSSPVYDEAISTNVLVAVQGILFFDDFETDKGWSKNNDWQRGQQTDDDFGPASAYSGSYCYGTRINAKYRNNRDSYLTSPVFDLADTEDPQMTFWMDIESEQYWDGGTVQIRVYNSSSWGSWRTIAMTDNAYYGNTPNDTDVDGLSNKEDGWSGNQPAGNWDLVGIDLFDLQTSGLTNITANSLIQVRFWFGSDGSVDGNGWYIDDFKISYSAIHGSWKVNAVNSDWNNTANWDDGQIPDQNTSVQIPGSAAHYPVVDEIAQCKKILIYDGGRLTITTGGDITVDRYISVGEGSSGQFIMNGGACSLGEDLFSLSGSLVDINGGTLSFDNWAASLTDPEAKGNIQLSGGDITATGDVLFSNSDVTGRMEGNFTLEIQGNYQSYYNSTDNQWPVVTGGTITMSGNGGVTTMSSDFLNKSVAYNLVIANPDIVETNGGVKVYNDCTIHADALFTVKAANSMEIGGKLMLISSNKSTASLLDYENISYGSVTMERYIEQGKWHALASPVSSPPLNMFNLDNFYYYDEAVADKWNNNDFVDGDGSVSDATGWTVPTQTQLDEPMRSFFTYYNHDSPTLEFSGTLNSGNYSITLNKTTSGLGDAFDGWNLIGNPYPSAIDLDLVNKGDIADAAFYFFRDDGTSNYNNYSYYIPSPPGSPYPSVAVNTRSNEIPANMGFFVKASNNGGSLQLTNNMRVHSREAYYKKSNKHHPQMLRLSLRGSNRKDEAVVRLIPEATVNYDGQFDAIKLPSPSSEIAQLYTVTPNNELLAINSFTDETMEQGKDIIVPLGMTIVQHGMYRISFDDVDFDSQNVFLRDHQLGEIVNVKDATDYEFFSKKGDILRRFDLVFTQSTQLDELVVAEIGIEGKKQKVEVDLKNGTFRNSTIKIYDPKGRLMKSVYVGNEPWVEVPVSVAGGIYLVLVRSQNKVHSQHVFIY